MPVQLLTPEGERVDHPDYPLHLTDEQYRSFYRDMVLVRRFDSEATALQRQGVPSRLVLFPDEGHWINKPQNSAVWYREFLGWLDRYLVRDSGSDQSRQ